MKRDGYAAGLYEEVHTSAVEAAFAQQIMVVPEFAPIPEGEIPAVLGRHVAAVVARVLDGQTAPDQQQYVNDVLRTCGTEQDVLLALDRLIRVRKSDPLRARDYRRPHTPLSETALLTNSRGEPSLSFELKTELVSADGVDLLCAFIRFAGIRVIKDQLLELREHGVPLRVITTTYQGVTERRALDLLVREVGAEVKVCYDDRSTRLHAKAWLLKRDSGYDTGYVGSSNLSQSALVDGLEWNVRISAVATPNLVRKFEATFETYWNDPAFETYDADTDGARFDAAVTAQGNAGRVTISGLEVRARPYQELMLEALASERVMRDRHRNLLVAATGTGKTVVAALDYRNLSTTAGRRPSLLFVAHRKEILEQALRTYREVMGDGSFGELYVDGRRPSEWRHVFASVQSLSSAVVREMQPELFEIVVIDEFHHAAAMSYRALLDHLRPLELLGLTATPERSDGFDVREFFDGRAAYELRLWDALDQDLLCPFHYYGIADNTDLSSLTWRRGGYAVEELEKVYTSDDARTRLVIAALKDRVTDPGSMRAVGFCVSVAHAEYMARSFSAAGFEARAITGGTPREERNGSLRSLGEGRVQVVFTVDVFNEGVDIPALDTILMLRPTESATLFQQQLGRGLRRTEGKAVLTVLDFIGQQRKEFRFANRYRTLVGGTGKSVERQIDEGFGYLPSGSQIVLDRVSREIVLGNIRTALRQSQFEQVRELQNLGDVGLSEYLAKSERELVDVYSRGSSWTDLRRKSGFAIRSAGSDDRSLMSRLWRLTCVDDPERSHYYSLLTRTDGPSEADLDERGIKYARMLLAVLWPGWGGLTDVDDGLRQLRGQGAVAEEIRELLAFTAQSSRRVAEPLAGVLGVTPLFTHATYHREEILIAMGWAKPGGRSPKGHATGVVWVPEIQTDAFFVTLRKEAEDFSPQTLYRDYPISLNQFHWESQNSTSVDSAVGQRYINHAERGTNVLLFTRLTRANELGSAPYLCLGNGLYVSHRGDRPISLTWKLQRPMPADVLMEASVVAS